MKELLDTIWAGISGSVWQILGTVLVAVASYVGAKIGQYYQKKANTEQKKEIVMTVVKMVEQVAKAKGWKGEEKLAEAKKNALQWLNNIGIKITDIN
jgi:predicted metalloendopeptidase